MAEVTKPISAQAGRATRRGPGRLSGSRALRGLAQGLLALAVTLLLAHTHVVPFERVVAGDVGGDYGQLSWNFWWMAERLPALENPFFTPDVYHPVGGYLTKHTYAFGFFPVGLAARAVMGPGAPAATVAYRASLLLAHGLGLWLAYRALRALGARPVPASAFGVSFVFSSFFAAHLPLVTLAAAALVVPALTLAFLRLVRAPSASRAMVLGGVVGCSIYLTEFSVFTLLALAIASALALASREARPTVLSVAGAVGLRGAGLASGLALLLAMPFLLNWVRDDGKAPKPTAAVNWSARPADLVVPDRSLLPLYRYRAPPWHEERWGFRGYGRGGSFLGFPVLLLGAYGAVALRGPRRALLLTVAAVFLVLSLGPWLDLGGRRIPLPFDLLREVPPFQMMRTPARLATLAQWALCGLAALALSQVMDRLDAAGRGGRARLLAAFVLAWSLGEGFRSVLSLESLTRPAELDQLVEGPVVNLPLGIMDGHAMFLQMWHGRPILTGYLSRRSPAQLEHVRRLQRAYDDGPQAFEAELAGFGTRNVIAGVGVTDEELERLRPTGLRVIDLRWLK